MNPALYLIGARIPRMVAVAAAPTMLVLFALIPAAKMAAGEREALAVSSYVLLLPLLWGWMFNSLVHETLHRPFAMLLPHAARRIFGGHAFVAGLVAVGFGAVAWFVSPSLPPVPLVALAAAVFISSLPYQEGRNGWVFSMPAMILAVAAIMDQKVGVMVVSWIKAAPSLWSFGGVAFVVACFVETWSKRRRRERAVTPYTSSFSAFLSGPLTRQRAAEVQGRKGKLRKTWTERTSPDSMWWWLKALRFERANETGRMSPLGAVTIGILACFAVLWLPALLGKQPGSAAAKMLASFANHPDATANGLGMFLLMQPLMMAIPRSRSIYPFSRRRRLAVTCLSAAVQLSLGCIAAASGALLAGAVAAVAERSAFPWSGYFDLLARVSTMLIFVPLMLWGRLQQEVRDSRWPVMFAVAVGLVLAPLVRTMIWSPENPLVPGAWPLDRLAWCWALIALSTAAGYVGLRHFFLRSDFLRR